MRKLLVAVAAACWLALGLTTQAAHAQDVLVCPPGTPVGDTTKCQGRDSIKAAIEAAASNSVIVIPGGSRNESGLTITDKDLTIRGKSARETIVQAGDYPCAIGDRVFHIDGSRVKLQDLTIQNGCIVDANQSAVGGGIWSEGSLTLERVIVRDNMVTYTGVGTASAPADAPADALAGDEAAAASTPRGGGIYAVGSLAIIDSTIISNSVNSVAGHALGGGIYNNGDSYIVNSTISGNRVTGILDFGTALAGGGIFNAGKLIMEYTTIVRNTAESASGGLHNTGEVELINNLFYANAPLDQVDCTSPGTSAEAGAAPTPSYLCDDPPNGLVDLGDLTEDTTLPVFLPAPNSASVDAGVCTQSKVKVDQRGNPRGQGNECDLGSVELGFTYMAWLKSSPPMPDLVVRDIIVEPAGDLTGGTQATIKVVIENIGNGAAMGGFYIDLFINPNQDPPNRGGYTWADFCRSAGCRLDEGIVWAAPLTVDPGEQFTFTSNLQTDPYVWRKSSQWDKYFTPGEVKLWAYVDSYQADRLENGYIEERHEDNNRFEKKAFTVLPGRVPDGIGSAAQVDVDPFAPRPRP